ncbi:F-box/LRR-repeat protein At3g26922-like [Vigna unguiculata]|uniref:F-box/LRR-repeat protein At3g26922-like n=1 Tax=Vigna unguiculata TaxID=3917 RepID=UPI0010161344|nr:F-box/LRR-repeat protein At3g26922-like [Vigna unguiculata]
MGTLKSFGMDAKCNKNGKQHEGETNSGTKLRDLPNEILQEVISNLPIKEAIQTDVISKKWRNQWKHISKVRLAEKGHREKKEFIDFVEKLLAVLNTSCIKIFSLACDVCEDTPIVNGWLSGFINPTIQELSLEFGNLDEEPLVFPDYLFSSKDLTHFHLSMPHLFMLPPFISFPSLTTMSLREVMFPDSFSTQRLFNGCPSLTQLTLIDCKWTNIETVQIACPSLQILTIREWEDDENDLIDDNDPTSCRIVITSSNLKTFSYDGDLLNDYVLDCNTSSITNGAVEVHPPPSDGTDAGLFVLRILKALSNVERLSISDFATEALCQGSFYIPELPLFNNLVELHVESTDPMNMACDALLTILRCSPRLEALYFAMGVFLHTNGLKKVYPLPACLETNLKTLRLYGFTGNKDELFAIKVLLKSTPVLEAIWIFSNPYGFDSDEGSDRLHRLYMKIVRFPRASVDCELYFE